MSEDRLSSTTTGKAWLSQFKSAADQAEAEKLLDAMLLVNEEQVATSIRNLLNGIGQAAVAQKHRVGLYVEREFPEKFAFTVESFLEKDGRVRMRATGDKGPVTIKPIRGSRRIGSEGSIASIVSSVVETNPAVFANHPGPDRIRSTVAPIREIVIVTDFLGSGARICAMLDKFWNVPSVKSWVSGKRLSFTIVAAVATSVGRSTVRKHRLAPTVVVDRVAPTIFTFSKTREKRWTDLINAYGPPPKSENPFGYKHTGALVAFSYRIPNNVPLLIRAGGGLGKKNWKPLYKGGSPVDLRAAFGLRTGEQRVATASENIGVDLDPELPLRDANMVLALLAVRGRWREESDYAIAAEIGLSVADVFAIRQRAISSGLLDGRGRLTNAGQTLIRAGKKRERRRPTILTNRKPYYPGSLRVPGGVI
jgi:hypothetical protein